MGVASFEHFSHLNTLYFTVFKKITKNNSLLALVRKHHLMENNGKKLYYCANPSVQMSWCAENMYPLYSVRIVMHFFLL